MVSGCIGKRCIQALMTSTSGVSPHGMCKLQMHMYLRDCLEAASAIRCHLAVRLDPCSVSPLLALPTPFHPAHAHCISANKMRLMRIPSLLHNAQCTAAVSSSRVFQKGECAVLMAKRTYPGASLSHDWSKGPCPQLGGFFD